ncbi:MAG: hypothetical protein IKR25_11585 [Muribaculaceae bacterium]|nr:hypothetical protein [Muribaculaceae bacterium]
MFDFGVQNKYSTTQRICVARKNRKKIIENSQKSASTQIGCAEITTFAAENKKATTEQHTTMMNDLPFEKQEKNETNEENRQ